MIFVTSLLLSVIFMTQAADPADPEPLNIFDVITDAPTADVKAALTGIKVYHGFKVIGEGRFLFVTSSNDTQSMVDIKFPEGSVVTQVPAEHRDDYNKKFGVDSGWEEGIMSEELVKEKIIAFSYLEVNFPADTTADEFISMLTEDAIKMARNHKVKPMAYAALASFPPKFYAFEHMENHPIGHIGKNAILSFGGPGNFKLLVKRVYLI